MSNTDNQPNTTEFNSSLATLSRVDKLIQLLHETALKGNKFLYLETLPRLYLEAYAKLTPNERKQCEAFSFKIASIRREYGNSLFTGSNASQKSEAYWQYQDAWGTLTPLLTEYELLLIKLLDGHGMLLTNKSDGTDDASR
jgi:hypothetical protein